VGFEPCIELLHVSSVFVQGLAVETFFLSREEAVEDAVRVTVTRVVMDEVGNFTLVKTVACGRAWALYS
jgi:hypothetical protein